MKRNAILLVLILLVLVTSIGFAMVETVDNWKIVPIDAGQGLYVPCSSGIVTSTVWDGMATIECHTKGK